MTRELLLPIGGGLSVRFDEPAAREAVPLAVATADREPMLQGTLEVMAWTDIEDAALARRILTVPEALVAILRARNTVLRDARDNGVLHAGCPNCDAEAIWTMPAFSILLGVEPPQWLDRGYFLEPLQMGVGLRRAERPDAPFARLEITLADGERRCLYPSSLDGPDMDLISWAATHAQGMANWEWLGRRALANAAVALDETIHATYARPVGEIFSLDALQWMTTSVPIHETFACPACGERYLPVHP